MKNTVLSIVKKLLPSYQYKDVKKVLNSCCKPSFSFDSMSCAGTSGDGGVHGTKFLGATISYKEFAGKDVIAILASTSFGGGSYQNITLDAAGNWSGDLQTSWKLSAPDFKATLSLLTKDGSVVLATSDEFTIENMPNCD